MTSAVRVRGLTKKYGDRLAVNDVSFDIEAGEVFSLLGPNGAGKTTTVEILEGFRKRTSGEVSVIGSDPQGMPRAWRDRIGVVLQTTTGLDVVTPREILRSVAKCYSRPRDVEAVIEATGLSEKANDLVPNLSGGQRRRLDVALGIIGTPDMLFLDEPTTGFDPEARRSFWQLIRSLSDDGTTILLTTHYLDEAEALADRVGVIASGTLLAIDTPANLGGRQQGTAHVTWEENGERHSVSTHTPTQEVARLAEHFGGEIPELSVTRPSLEDTYLAMIGPHLAAAGEEMA